MRLEQLKHLESDPRITFKTEIVNDQQLTIVSYMISDETLWNQPGAIECRGITFNSAGECICRPFEKFFNVGERTATQKHALDWTDDLLILDKRDGSMVTPVALNGEIKFKTKKSFFSDVANLANESVPFNVLEYSREMLKRGITPIFEFTHPDAEIVINYGNDPKFTLLAARDMATGEYVDYEALVKAANWYALDLVKSFSLAPSEIFEQAKHLEDFEGWVINFKNTGIRVKQKTDWYLRLHRVKTDLRERDVAEMVVDETIDDVKSSVTAAGLSLDPVSSIEAKVSQQLSEIISNVDHTYNEWKHLDRKEFALTLNNHQYFGLLMKRFTGNEPDFKRQWKKDFLQSYSLRAVYHKMF